MVSDPPLRTWFTTLKQRALIIETGPFGLTVSCRTPEGHPATSHDRHMLARHHHALTIAATGTHPAWWDHVAGRTHTVPTDDQLPHLDPGTYPCATCAAPADWLDDQLLAWCELHVDPQLVTDAHTWRAA